MSEELILRLKAPVSMSMFATKTDLYMDVLQQRKDAAERIEELEQKLRTTSLEALAISDTNNEMAMRIAELQADLEREKKETERLDGAWHALHDRMVKDNAAHARYFEKSQARIHELFDAQTASQARLSEAVKVLGQCRLAFAGYVSVQSAVDMLDNFGTEGQAKAFITTLGGEQE